MNIIRSGRFRIGIGIGIGDFDSDADPKKIHTRRFRYDPKIVGADSDAAPIPKKVKFAHLYIETQVDQYNRIHLLRYVIDCRDED
jgi:hypothetical protein